MVSTTAAEDTQRVETPGPQHSTHPPETHLFSHMCEASTTRQTMGLDPPFLYYHYLLFVQTNKKTFFSTAQTRVSELGKIFK